MKRRAPLLSALLYAAALAGANPAAAQEVTPELLATLKAGLSGDMRKLALAEAPGRSYDAGFRTAAGEDTTLAAEAAGRIALVNFWATWCAPCREEMPALNALEKELGGPDFTVITIATGPNNPAKIDRFMEDEGIDALPRHTDQRAALGRQAGVLGLPVTMILDREGRELGRLTGGADWASPEARALIEALIAGEPAS
ncbi:TlpA disulfide reductase family protein [Oceanicella sp. SM1341]|uniref:TlpA disulfide reductase family protein n=1 Tax=Oceanicella sp. SM1341 TaxID=1548889 RepID=UPI000E4F69C4|nr:TlpA disulfide reductase family protein [Oceanicella sp. SM1341]